jgi:Ca2+-binding EF-hand superfamily protein
VHIRGEILKEKLWSFSSLEELVKFQNLANSMYNFGKRLRYLFDLIDVDKSNYIDQNSLKNIVLNDININSDEFFENGITRLINEGDVLNSGKVNFTEFFIIFMNSKAKSLTELLNIWKSIADDTYSLTNFDVDNNNDDKTSLIDAGYEKLNISNDDDNNNDKSLLNNFLETLQINKNTIKLRSECLYVGLSDNINMELYSNSTFVDSRKSDKLQTANQSSENLTKSSSFFSTNAIFPNMLPGEKVLLNTEEIVFVDGSTLNQIVGTLGIIILTNFRLCFKAAKPNKNDNSFNSPPTSQYVMIPISTICGMYDFLLIIILNHYFV